MVKRIVLHWSAGRYYPTEFEKNHYHYLIDAEGKVCIKGFINLKIMTIVMMEDMQLIPEEVTPVPIGVTSCGMYGYKSKNILWRISYKSGSILRRV